MSKKGKTGNKHIYECTCTNWMLLHSHFAVLLHLSAKKSKAEMHPYKSNLISLGFRPASSEKRVASPSNTPPVGTTSPSPTPPATPARRGGFTREEYARRQQLRIMDDLDKVLRQKSTNQGRSSAKKTRSRPRSMTREETQLSLSPAKGKTGKVKSEKKLLAN